MVFMVIGRMDRLTIAFTLEPQRGESIQIPVPGKLSIG